MGVTPVETYQSALQSALFLTEQGLLAEAQIVIDLHVANETIAHAVAVELFPDDGDTRRETFATLAAVTHNLIDERFQATTVSHLIELGIFVSEAQVA